MTAMGYHASMFGYLAENFEQKLIDPLYKPKSRAKTFAAIFKFF